MKISKLLNINLLTAALIAAASIHSKGQKRPDCQEIVVKIEVTDSSADLANGSIRVTPETDQKIVLHLLEVGAPVNNRLDIKSLTISNLKKGEYDLVITTEREGNYCPKVQRIKVK